MLVVKWEEGRVEGEMMKVEVIVDDEEGCLHMMIGGREVVVHLMRMLVLIQGFDQVKHYFWGEMVLPIHLNQSFLMMGVHCQARQYFHCFLSRWVENRLYHQFQ
jgi:hypothetical protein